MDSYESDKGIETRQAKRRHRSQTRDMATGQDKLF